MKKNILSSIFISYSFLFLWLFHLFCLFGSEMLRFVLPFWFYVKEGDLTLFSYSICAGLLPRILSPLLGGLVDYYKPKKILFIGCLGLIVISSIFSLVTAELVSINIWEICLLIFTMGMFSNSIHLATLSSISKIIKAENFLKGNSMMICAESSAVIIAPLLGGFMIYKFGITAVVLIGILLFLCSSNFLIFVKSFSVDKEEISIPFFSKLKNNLRDGFLFLRSSKELKLLLLIVSFINFIFTLNFTFFTPMVLVYSNNDSELMGLINFVGGCGQILGAVMIGYVFLPRDRISAIFKTVFILGVSGPALIGFQSSPILWCIGYAFTLGFISIINTINNSYWQTITPMHLQGSIFGIRRMITSSTGPLGALMAGPTLHYISNNHLLQNIGSDYQVIFICSGILISILGLGGFLTRFLFIQKVKV